MMAIHRMNLQAEPFHMISSGQKKFELRLNDEKRRLIRINDTIVFTNTVDPNEQLTVVVNALHHFSSFEELYASLPLLQCGYTANNINSASPADMLTYYSPDKIRQYGVLAIEVSLI